MVSVKYLAKSNVEEFIEESKKLIGKSVEEWGQPGNLTVTQKSLIDFVNVTGDTNPLYREPDYAFRTRYGCVTATPAFVAAIRCPETSGAYSMKDFGLANFLSSAEFEWQETAG